MTWEIVAGIIMLVGSVSSLGAMIWKLSSVISKLSVKVDNIGKQQEKDEKMLNGRIDERKGDIKELERRINKVEDEIISLKP